MKTIFSPIVAVRLALLATVLFAVSSSRAEVFLMLQDQDGAVIKGESLDADFNGIDGWFRISNYSLGITNSLNIGSATTGAGAGKAGFESFSITKAVDIITPKLIQAVGTGNHFKTAKLAVRKPGAKAYLTFEFNLVAVAAQEWSGNDSDAPIESVRFEFGSLRVSYSSEKPTGGLNPPVVQSWNKISNSEVFEIPTL